MINLRIACKEWATLTFEEMLHSLEHSLYSEELMLYTEKILKTVKKHDQKVDGYSSEGLPKTQEQHTGFKIKYSEVFHYLVDGGIFTPVHYILELVKRGSYEQKMNDENLNRYIGFISRGIRSLTSFIREPDFAFQLKNKLLLLDPNVITELNHEQDSKDHTDVLVTFNNIQYRFWLYQFSSRGLPHDIERVTGKRGELLSGIHVLCPLVTERAQEKKIGTIEKRIRRNVTLLLKKEKELTICSIRAVKRKENLILDIERIKSSIKIDQETIEMILEEIKDELEIIEGWFFYSDEHIQRIAEQLINTEPDDYYEIRKKLLFAEQYLGNTNFIKV